MNFMKRFSSLFLVLAFFLNTFGNCAFAGPGQRGTTEYAIEDSLGNEDSLGIVRIKVKSTPGGVRVSVRTEDGVNHPSEKTSPYVMEGATSGTTTILVEFLDSLEPLVIKINKKDGTIAVFGLGIDDELIPIANGSKVSSSTTTGNTGNNSHPTTPSGQNGTGTTGGTESHQPSNPGSTATENNNNTDRPSHPPTTGGSSNPHQPLADGDPGLSNPGADTTNANTTGTPKSPNDTFPIDLPSGGTTRPLPSVLPNIPTEPTPIPRPGTTVSVPIPTSTPSGDSFVDYSGPLPPGYVSPWIPPIIPGFTPTPSLPVGVVLVRSTPTPD